MLNLFAGSSLVLAFCLGANGQDIAKPLLSEKPAAVEVITMSSDEHGTTNTAEDDSAVEERRQTPPSTEPHPVITQSSQGVASAEPLFSFANVEAKATHAKLFMPPTKLNEAASSKTTSKTTNGNSAGFRWRSAISQQLLFLAVQHGYALTQPKTRRELRGAFVQDYFDSVASLDKWDDGGRFFTNYVAHPLQGAFSGFTQIQNDPRGRTQQFGRSKAYWQSRMKAMAWSAAWSTQFEIGPLSQASIGNVGLKGKQTWVDIVVTPTVGTALLVSEDALDRYAVRWIERRTDNFYAKIAGRMLLNPSRTCANLIRFKKPWHRDR